MYAANTAITPENRKGVLDRARLDSSAHQRSARSRLFSSHDTDKFTSKFYHKTPDHLSEEHGSVKRAKLGERGDFIRVDTVTVFAMLIFAMLIKHESLLHGYDEKALSSSEFKLASSRVTK